jgi:hypothetical protein
MTSKTSRRPARLLRAALEAAEAGLYVFPVQPRGKTPAVRDWESGATRDAEQITAWWAARPYNVGLAVGRSRLLVVDLDPGRGDTPPAQWAGARGGWDVLAALATTAGAPMPGDTYTVTTPSSGRHLYYRQPEGLELRNTQSGLGWRIDTRGHGGFVVGAGSVRDEGRYRVTCDAPIAALPGWLANALTPPPPAPAAGVAPGSNLRLPPTRARAYLAAIIQSETRAVAHAQTGQRHRTLLRAARTLGRLVAGGELDEPTARAALLDAAAGHIGVEGTTAREVRQTIDDGLAYGAQAPRTIRGATGH